VSAKVPGLVRFTVAGKAGAYPVELEDAEPQLRASLLVGPDDGECGEVEFAGPPPGPACVAKVTKGKVRCK